MDWSTRCPGSRRCGHHLRDRHLGLNEPPNADRTTVKAIADRLVADGNTNAEHGLQVVYQMVAKTGQTNPEVLVDQINESSRAVTTLSAIGVGMATPI